MKVQVPQEIARTVADRSLRNVRAYAQEKRWRSGLYLNSVFGNGYAGLSTERKYLMFVERGTRPFLMKSLEGRTIVIDGQFKTVRGVGQPGWVTLPGGVRVYREQKWRHPGIKPRNFMRDSISSAIDESRDEIRRKMVEVLTGG